MIHDTLNTEMAAGKAFDCRRNPALTADLSSRQLAYVLGQYSIFPACIVSLLTMARNQAVHIGWAAIQAELERNIAEEEGSDSEGVPHYDMLAAALREECGVAVSPSIFRSAATQQFLASMQQLFAAEDAVVGLGAVYATESSAVPELRVVLKIITRLREQRNRGHLPLQQSAKTFFELHLSVWEPGHELGLRRTTRHILSSQSHCDRFAGGFRAVITAMEQWWAGLTEEARALQ